MVPWLGVISEFVDQNSKISVGERRKGLDQSVGLAAIFFFLQLEQDVFLVFEEGVDNLLRIWSSCEAARQESETAFVYCHFTVHLNGFGVWERIDFIHVTHCSRCIILNFLTAPVNLKKNFTKWLK